MRESDSERLMEDDEPDWYEEIVVEENYDGWRLDRYLTQKIRRASRSKVRSIILTGVSIDPPRRIKAGLTVRTGDRIRVARTERADPETPPLSAVRVITRGERWVAVDKPPGMLVHRTAHEATRTIVRYLQTEFDDRVEPVHRLDRDTSGVVLCGVGAEAIRDLRATFQSGDVQKEYRAVVADPGRFWPVGASRQIDKPLGFDRTSEVRLRMGAGELACCTTATCLARGGSRALLAVEIERGRQHQIRVHLHMLGTPVLGDKLYEAGDEFFMKWSDEPGKPALLGALACRWHALHSHRIRLSFDGEAVDVASEPSRLIELLDEHAN